MKSVANRLVRVGMAFLDAPDAATGGGGGAKVTGSIATTSVGAAAPETSVVDVAGTATDTKVHAVRPALWKAVAVMLPREAAAFEIFRVADALAEKITV